MLCALCALCPQVYDEYDDEVAEAELAEERGLAAAAAGAALPEDRDDQLKPFIHKGAGHGEAGGGGGGDGGEGGEDGGGGDDDGDDDDEVARWSLRRCSAAGLDMLSTVFGDELLPIILPVVQERLQVGSVCVWGGGAYAGWPPSSAS